MALGDADGDSPDSVVDQKVMRAGGPGNELELCCANAKCSGFCKFTTRVVPMRHFTSFFIALRTAVDRKFVGD